MKWHTTFGEISVEEPQLRRGNQRIRPFASSAGVHHRGTSQPLQRAVTDLAADVPFAQAMDKLVEHYGVLLCENTIRRITLGHAHRMFEETEEPVIWPEEEGQELVIAEMDGGMVPIMEPNKTEPDQRKGKQLQWREAKICFARAADSRTLSYGGTLQGGVGEAGNQLFECAINAGFGKNSHLHAVGDGASWIATQVEEKFGAQGSYLVDFYHVCDYLSAAAKAIPTNGETVDAWMDTQKERLKKGEAETVLHALAPHIECADTEDVDAPVRRCHRYLSQRLHQLQYDNAIARGLPIGSGEIESAHRYIVQQRLKRPGAWWRAENAEDMLALWLNRANRQWQAYWAQQLDQAA